MRRNLEVVVVDDEKEITELLRTFILFVSREIRVHTFNDSMAAKEFIVHNPVDMLITDYNMPGLDGLALIESAPAHAKKVLISGYIGEIAEHKLQTLNATCFEKPVPLHALSKVVADENARVAALPEQKLSA